MNKKDRLAEEALRDEAVKTLEKGKGDVPRNFRTCFEEAKEMVADKNAETLDDYLNMHSMPGAPGGDAELAALCENRGISVYVTEIGENGERRGYNLYTAPRSDAPAFNFIKYSEKEWKLAGIWLPDGTYYEYKKED